MGTDDQYEYVYCTRIWNKKANRYVYPRNGRVFRLRVRKGKRKRGTTADRKKPSAAE